MARFLLSFRIPPPHVSACLVLMLLLAGGFVPARADLPLLYRSDDADLPLPQSLNLSDLTAEELARYFDAVFPEVPEKVFQQNVRFVSSFPATDVWESAVPEGVQVSSSGVIRDAYVKLIPVNLVKTDGGFLSGKIAKVGFVADYRVELPPDRTSSYPKHYYSLVSHDMTVRINGKSFDTSKGVVTLSGSVDRVVAEASIRAVVREKIVDLETDCWVEDNETVCDTYEVTTYRTHRYSLTVKDSIEILNGNEQEVTGIYTLVSCYNGTENCKVQEHWILPGSTVAAVGDGNGSTLIGGLKEVASFRWIDAAEVKGKGGSRSVELDEPAYTLLLTPGRDVLVYDASCRVPYMDARPANQDIPNFRPEGGLYSVKSFRLVCGKSAVPLDIFGNELPYESTVKYLVEPVVDVEKQELPGGWEITMKISYGNVKYSGTVQVNTPSGVLFANVTNGVASFTMNGSGRVSYFIPSDLPEDWYNSDETYFFMATQGGFQAGRIPFSLPFYEFVLLLAAITPFLLAYVALRWVFSGEDEEYL